MIASPAWSLFSSGSSFKLISLVALLGGRIRIADQDEYLVNFSNLLYRPSENLLMLQRRR